jgi:hypothetical protein
MRVRSRKARALHACGQPCHSSTHMILHPITFQCIQVVFPYDAAVAVSLWIPREGGGEYNLDRLLDCDADPCCAANFDSPSQERFRGSQRDRLEQVEEAAGGTWAAAQASHCLSDDAPWPPVPLYPMPPLCPSAPAAVAVLRGDECWVPDQSFHSSTRGTNPDIVETTCKRIQVRMSRERGCD